MAAPNDGMEDLAWNIQGRNARPYTARDDWYASIVPGTLKPMVGEEDNPFAFADSEFEVYLTSPTGREYKAIDPSQIVMRNGKPATNPRNLVGYVSGHDSEVAGRRYTNTMFLVMLAATATAGAAAVWAAPAVGAAEGAAGAGLGATAEVGAAGFSGSAGLTGAGATAAETSAFWGAEAGATGGLGGGGFSSAAGTAGAGAAGYEGLAGLTAEQLGGAGLSSAAGTAGATAAETSAFWGAEAGATGGLGGAEVAAGLGGLETGMTYGGLAGSVGAEVAAGTAGGLAGAAEIAAIETAGGAGGGVGLGSGFSAAGAAPWYSGIADWLATPGGSKIATTVLGSSLQLLGGALAGASAEERQALKNAFDEAQVQKVKDDQNASIAGLDPTKLTKPGVLGIANPNAAAGAVGGRAPVTMPTYLTPTPAMGQVKPGVLALNPLPKPIIYYGD